MKIMMPAGFMVGTAGKSLAITICDGRGAPQTRQISLPQTGHARDNPEDHGKAADACPYAALSMAAWSGTPAVLLLVALAFILMRRSAMAVAPHPAALPYLRPPLRAPPMLA